MHVLYQPRSHAGSINRVHKKNATSEFPKKSTLQFLSIKDFSLGIEIEFLIDHIYCYKCINFALHTRVRSNLCYFKFPCKQLKFFCP
jgi:hypothetical protein